MADPVDLDAWKKSGGPGGPKTDPVVAARLRAAVEYVIEQGVVAGVVSGETASGGLTWAAEPHIRGFLLGHIRQVHDEIVGFPDE